MIPSQMTTAEAMKKHPSRRLQFYDVGYEEPHRARTAEILEKYPQITELFGPEPRTKFIVAATVLLQLSIAYWAREQSWSIFILTAYVIGATANQSLFLAVHELSHNLGSKSHFRNKMYAVMANIPIGLPFCATFGPYHYEHHRHQGDEKLDVDLATPYEAEFFSARIWSDTYVGHCAAKAVFMFTQIFFYALRPMLANPDTLNRISKTPYYLINQVVVLGLHATLVYNFGFFMWFYLLLSTFFAGSIHPVAGHFLAEHYIFDNPEHETYSYYGPLNYVTYNVGLHNIHHDFPAIPWSRLHNVLDIAPEYYKDLPVCESWWGAIMRFIFDDNVTPFSRVRRPHSMLKANKEAKLAAIATAVNKEKTE